MRRLAACGLLAFGVAACSAPASESIAETAEPAPRTYRVLYTVALRPETASAEVELALTQGSALLREMRFRLDGDRFDGVRGDGEVWGDGDEVSWLPPAGGGRLRWRVSIPNRRGGEGYDAWLGLGWGIFRAEDIIPRAATRTLVGAHSDTYLEFSLPPGWSVVTEYPESDGRFDVDRPGRRFAEPAGWIAAGDLGVRRERIAGVRVAVAGPTGHDVRRMDLLALLNWTLPELERILGDMPPRLTIVSAGEPMWRGGLSAPQSLYIHAERPMLSENGTSTLLHEILHVALGLSSRRGHDWIVEGLAEYYSLELLKRSGTISPARHERAMASLAEWAASATTLCRDPSTGARTAMAVGVFAALDREMRQVSDGKAGLDDLLVRLAGRGASVDLEALSRAVTRIIGRPPRTLRPDRLPGCDVRPAGAETR